MDWGAGCKQAIPYQLSKSLGWPKLFENLVEISNCSDQNVPGGKDKYQLKKIV